MSSRGPAFGRIDPFCLLAVLPFLCIAGLLTALGRPWGGVVFVVLAGLVVLFDAWANRPLPERPRRRVRPVLRGPERPPQRSRTHVGSPYRRP